jgi:rfaE bifunctional protein kinase chain/domain
MLRLDFSQQEKVSESVHAQLAETVSQEARNADVVIVSDYGAGVLGPQVKKALQAVMKSNVPVCVDSRHDLFGFRGATVCKPNEPELAELLGRPLNSHADLMEAGSEARKRLNCQTLLVTRGRNGMVVFEKGNRTRSIPVQGMLEAVDVTGAGDTVISALAVSIAAKANAWEASLISNVAGGLVVQKQGTATVSFDELITELEKLP